MHPLKLDEDIRPLSEFRSGVASFVKQVNDTGRPLVLTRHGRGVAVLVDIHEFETMRERLETLEDIAVAREQLAAGGGTPHDEAKARVLKTYRCMRVISSDRALERVEEIALYISRDSVETAARWTDELFREVERLGTFPQSGKIGRDVETPGIRELVWGTLPGLLRSRHRC